MGVDHEPEIFRLNLGERGNSLHTHHAITKFCRVNTRNGKNKKIPQNSTRRFHDPWES
jgi:hypothetical protein